MLDLAYRTRHAGGEPYRTRRRRLNTMPLSILLAQVATCLSFFSRLPVRRRPDAWASAPTLAASVGMLPLAGMLIGSVGAIALSLSIAIGLPPLVASLMALLAVTTSTGGLHEDGLADTADGFGGGRTREAKLAIMRDSRIGSYGVLALTFSLALRWSALAALLNRSSLQAAAAVVAAAALSRALALLPIAMLPPARDQGLGHGFGRPSRTSLAVCFGLAAAIGLILPNAAGGNLGHAALACVASAAAAAFVAWLADRQIGGHTGDVAGAAQQAAETTYLLGLLALPGSL